MMVRPHVGWCRVTHRLHHLGALALVLTVSAGRYSLLAWRRRGPAAGLRGLAWTLVPVAAWLTGTLKLAATSSTTSPTGPPAWCSPRSSGSASSWPGCRSCCSCVSARCAPAACGHPGAQPSDRRPSPSSSRRQRQRSSEGGREARAGDRRPGRHRGDPEEARASVRRRTDPRHDVARHQLARRLNRRHRAPRRPGRRRWSWSTSTPSTPTPPTSSDAPAASPIRVASKSLRVPALVARALGLPGFAGVLAYSLREALWLVARASPTTS